MYLERWAIDELSELYAIDLNSGTYMDEPPPGAWCTIMEAYRRHAVAIRAEWDRIHGR